MTVGAISSYYSTFSQSRYFGTVISSQKLQSLFEKYGIKQTGDTDADLEALYKAIYSDASTEVTGTTSSGKIQGIHSQEYGISDSSTVPWADLMAQVGLSATGVLDTDYAAFNDRIEQMQQAMASSANPQVQASIDQLKAEADQVFTQQTQSVVSSSHLGSQSDRPKTSGAEIAAQLNKLYLLG